MSDLFILFIVYGSAWWLCVLIMRAFYGKHWVKEFLEDTNLKALFEKGNDEITKKD